MATINCWPHWSTRTVIIIRHRYRTIPSTIWWISDNRWFTFRYFARIPILLCSFICLQYIFVCLPNWFWFLLNINIKPQQKAADVIYTQNDISTISSFRLNKKKSNFFRNFIISSIQKWCNRIFSQQSQFRFVHSNFTYIVFLISTYHFLNVLEMTVFTYLLSAYIIFVFFFYFVLVFICLCVLMFGMLQIYSSQFILCWNCALWHRQIKKNWQNIVTKAALCMNVSIHKNCKICLCIVGEWTVQFQCKIDRKN